MCSDGTDIGTTETHCVSRGINDYSMLAEVTKYPFPQQDDINLFGGEKMKQEITFHCIRCKREIVKSFEPSGCKDDIVLKGITLKCKACTRVITPRNYTEGHILENVVDGKFYI